MRFTVKAVYNPENIKGKEVVETRVKNKSFDQIVDELEEGADVVQPLYDFVLKHIDLNEDEMVQKYLENIEWEYPKVCVNLQTDVR